MIDKKLRNIRLEGVITALSPVFHGGNEKTGSSQLLRRQKFFVGNTVKEIPIISGNAIRGYTRRLLMSDLLDRLDYRLQSLTLYHSLFSGGVLEQVKGKTGFLDLETRKKIRELLPPISVYGISYGNQIFAGKLKVKEMLPLCIELKDLLPEEFAEQCTNDIYTFLDHTFFSRKDDSNNANILKLSNSEETKKNDPVQMLVDLEVFSTGTKFYHGFSLEKANEREIAVLAHIINLWQQSPYVGGKSSSGYGEIKISYQDKLASEPYLTFIETNREKMKAFLEQLDGALA